MKTFIKKFLTICLLYLNTVVLFYSVHNAWRTYYVYNTFGSPNLDSATHIFIARLLILSPIAMISFVLATYLLIKIVKRVTYNIKKEIRTNEYEKRLAEKHKRWRAYFNSIDTKYSYHIYDNNGGCSRYIYDSNGDCIGYVID